MNNANEVTKASDINIIARALVPFFVQYVAAFRAYECPHVNQTRASGGAVAHRATTYHVYNRARAALIRSFEMSDADRSDKAVALAVAEQILAAESKARYSGRPWNAHSAVEGWMASA